MINIVPCQDQKEHELLTTCSCNPDLLMENGEMIIVHHAYDGRELIEEAIVKAGLSESFGFGGWDVIY